MGDFGAPSRISRIYENIEDIGQLHLRENVVSLNLHGNALLTSHGLLPFHRLVELDLSANSIKSLADFDNLQLLEKLNLSSNLLEKLPPNIFAPLTSLRELNLSYNGLTDVDGLRGASEGLSRLQLHGNALPEGLGVINVLSGLNIVELTLADNGFSVNQINTFHRIKTLQCLDGLTSSGEPWVAVDDRLHEPPRVKTLVTPTPRARSNSGNPWENSRDYSHAIDIREHVLRATENLTSKYESAQLETASKIESLEKQLKELIRPGVSKKPQKSVTKVAKPKPCLACGKLFEQVRAMQTVLEEHQRAREKLQDELERVKLESNAKLENQQSVLFQKSSQLEAALEAASKFKCHLNKEKEKVESLEQAAGRLNKQLNVTQAENKQLCSEQAKRNDEVEKLRREQVALKTQLEERASSCLETAQAKTAAEATIAELRKRLENYIDPESGEFRTLLRQKTTQVELAFNQYKFWGDYERRYGALESEFRAALVETAKRHKTHQEELQTEKEKNVTLQLEREKLLSEVTKKDEKFKMEQKRNKENDTVQRALEDKVERLVEALRKTKELADDRYRDEQKVKSKLRDTIQERSKLIETVTEQDGIIRGLEKERSRWSRDLADRTAQLADEKSQLTMKEKLFSTQKTYFQSLFELQN